MAKKKTTKSSKPMEQPLSPMTYAFISLVAFGIGIGLLYLIILKADILTKYGLVGNVFYVLLIPLGLSAGAFLFGVMSSYAAYQGKVLGGVLKLGGPAVVSVLVVVGGFYLPQPQPSTFDMKVFVHGINGEHDIVLENEGEVMITYGGKTERREIGQYGEAVFSEIPAEFYGKTVPVTVVAKGFEKNTQNIEARETVYVEAKRDDSLSKVFGTVRDDEGNFLKNVQVSIEDLQTLTGANGYFNIKIPIEKQKTQQTLTVSKQEYQTKEFLVYPGNKDAVEIILPKK